MAGHYGKASWQKRRAHQLRHYPLCAMCLAEGIPTPATVADHVTPHRGDGWSFWNGRLQSLCKYHHDSTKQLAEARDQGRYKRQLERRLGYTPGYGLDGWPTDPRHPCYQTPGGKGPRPSPDKNQAGGGGVGKNSDLGR